MEKLSRSSTGSYAALDEVAILYQLILTVFLLLLVTWGLPQGFDDQGRGGWNDADLGLSERKYI